jgi:hypothetical protein
MPTIQERFCPERPPACATDGKGAYREARGETWGQVPAYQGQGRPPQNKQPGQGWQYVQGVKTRDAHRGIGVSTTLVYGDPETTLVQVGPIRPIGTDRPYLDNPRVTDYGSPSRYQLYVGRLPPTTTVINFSRLVSMFPVNTNRSSTRENGRAKSSAILFTNILTWLFAGNQSCPRIALVTSVLVLSMSADINLVGTVRGFSKSPLIASGRVLKVPV